MSTEWIFGFHAVTTVLRARPSDVHRILVDGNRQDQRVDQVVKEAATHGVPVERAARDRIDSLAARDGEEVRHQGILAEVRIAQAAGEDALYDLLDHIDGPPLLLVLDGVKDPHNLGACLRTAEAAGVHGVIVPKDRAAGLTATVRKVAAGAVETVPFFQVTNLARCLRALKERGVWFVGFTGEAQKTLYETSLSGPVGIVLGAEDKGMRRLTQEICDFQACIPMVGGTESVNVSVATGIALFEAVRQRRFASH